MVIRKKATQDEVHIKKISLLLEKIGITWENISHYILAFIHRSIVNEKPDYTPEHNERLEFLWDAVLELVITEHLFKDFPEKSEWELTDIRSALVRGRNLAKIAKNLGLSEFLLLGKWEDLWWGRTNEYLLANTVEALIGAIYIDVWYDEAQKFIDTYVYSTLKWILQTNHIKDYKTTVQELAQAQFDITPTYKLLGETGKDHEKEFLMWIFFEEKEAWKWIGSSKKKAQEAAAFDAYNNFFNI